MIDGVVVGVAAIDEQLGGRTPVRASICSGTGVAWPWSDPRLVTLTPTMARAASVVVASWTLNAGRKRRA
jgi:hypothetical protein